MIGLLVLACSVHCVAADMDALYDKTNRLTDVTLPGSSRLGHQYDAAGNLIRATKRGTRSLVERFFDPFDGSALAPLVWNAVLGPGGLTVANGTVVLRAGSQAQTGTNHRFSAERIVVQARFAGESVMRDTAVSLVDTSTGEAISLGDTDQQEIGFYAQGSGSFQLPRTAGISPTTPAFQVYRASLSGNWLVIERGTDATNLTAAREFELASTIVGRTFSLRISTGASGTAYEPGTFDWVSLSTGSGLANPANGHVYQLVQCGSWATCRDLAASMGGQLASVRSQGENDWLVRNFPMTKNLWIGATRDPSTGTWRWSGGDAFTYVNWGRNLNNLGGNENCAHYYGVTPGVWNDIRCDEPTISQAIVEFR